MTAVILPGDWITITSHNLHGVASVAMRLVERTVEVSNAASDSDERVQTLILADHLSDSVYMLRSSDSALDYRCLAFYVGNEVRYFEDGTIQLRNSHGTWSITPVA